jgi:UDP-N-acetylglucosamine 2-epimerase (non-hydrolysing)
LKSASKPLKVLVVAGARPNFVKVAPILRAMAARPEYFLPILVHTGQHYDSNMSDVFFQDLAVPRPDHFLGVGSGTHAEQVARVMIALETILDMEAPQWVVVVGDVNSTMAAALTAVKKGIRTAHVEAGLRSYDRTMPEEINRIVTDAVCDLLLTPSEDADRNLRREGIPNTRIVRVGNVMIDSLMEQLPAARSLRAWEPHEFEEKRYILATLHRPSNVDDLENLARIVAALADIAREIPVFFPVHPRTAMRLKSTSTTADGVRFSAPLGYRAFISVLSGARLVLTDSGGVQEESSFLGVPCLTLRDSTERPVTIQRGTNILLGKDATRIAPTIREHLTQVLPKPCSIPLWDGHAAERILKSLLDSS